MKILYTSDLHGEIHLYEELLAVARPGSAGIIILGGDLLPSFAPTKRYEEMIPHQRNFIDRFLRPFLKKIVETTAVQKILLIPGNWDLGYPYLFETPSDRLIDLDRKGFRLDGEYELIGYPFVPPTPFRPKDFEKMDDPGSPWPPQRNPSYIRSPDQMDQIIPIDPNLYLRGQGTIGEDLCNLPRPVYHEKAIYVMHSPPFGTRLDLIQGGESAGSRSITRFIEKTQPLLTLHGHIHEAPELSGTYLDRIGATLCINPGQFTRAGKGSSRLHAVLFEMEDVEGTLMHTCFR